jgi:membrane protein YdbS with pleckstrin-like domain
MTPLHPRQLTLIRIRAAILAAFPLGLALFADAVWLRQTSVPYGLASGAAALLIVSLALLMPRRRYRAWGYEMGDDELHVQHGLFTRVRTVVPFGRVQHIDVTQGPLERRFGLGTLVLHTAGTRSSEVGLPGLLHEEAARFRDHIRTKIREDLG